MNYQFSNLLGVPYRGGNVVFAGDQLLAPASNRVREIALNDAACTTYPFESQHQVQVIALSPDGGLLLMIDTSARLLLALRHTKVLLHRMRLKAPSQAAAFSPDGKFIAIAVGKVLQVCFVHSFALCITIVSTQPWSFISCTCVLQQDV
jgi:periodic tryptophan protein 2